MIGGWVFILSKSETDFHLLFRCVFDLRMYPFDTQTCELVFKYPEYYRHFVRLRPEAISYVGKPDELTEYLIDKIHLCSTDNSSGSN